MLLTITNTSAPATNLGYLLVKLPNRLQSFEAAFGKIYVFYPEATAERCTVALLLDVDSVALVRGRSGSRGDGALLDQLALRRGPRLDKQLLRLNRLRVAALPSMGC
jgi:hypothetical protein